MTAYKAPDGGTYLIGNYCGKWNAEIYDINDNFICHYIADTLVELEDDILNYYM